MAAARKVALITDRCILELVARARRRVAETHRGAARRADRRRVGLQGLTGLSRRQKPRGRWSPNSPAGLPRHYRCLEIKAKLAVQGLIPAAMCGADFGALIRKQYDSFGRTIREANIKAE